MGRPDNGKITHILPIRISGNGKTGWKLDRLDIEMCSMEAKVIKLPLSFVLGVTYVSHAYVPHAIWASARIV